MSGENQNYFWVVWNPAAGNPQFTHGDKESAEQEAKRLALKNPSQIFFVLQTVSSFEFNTVLRTDLTPPDERPF